MRGRPTRLTASAASLAALVVVVSLGAQGPAPGSADRQSKSDRDRRPTVVVRATPAVSFSPARVVVVAELRGGANDYEEFYCAAVEWDWGDGTRSQASYDCDPYEPGKSEIRRRFTNEHTYYGPGSYRVQFRLKRNEKVVAMATTTVQVRPGVRDIGAFR